MDTQVVCRELGLLVEGAVAVGGSAYSKPNLTVHLSNVHCTGSEENIAQCMYTSLSLEDGKALLDQVEVAGLSCKEPNVCEIPPTGGSECSPGDIRLTAENNSALLINSTTSQGNLEYCYKGLWSSVCSISESAAAVACKQMGFTTYSWASIYDDDYFDLSSNPSFIENLVCSESASEANLTECTLFDACNSTCNSGTVGIQCYEPGECLEGSVQLADGDISQEGRVEVCLGGIWGSVCGDGWDQMDAYILCEQLDLGEGEPTLYSNSEFGEGEGPVVLSSVECNQWDTDIFQCSSKQYLSFSCPRSHTAGVLCRDSCSDGDLRLTGGQTENEGTVEICFDNLWGLMAQNEWSTADATVTCRQLGFPSEEALAVVNSYYGKPNRTLHLTTVVCTGLEDRLTECSHSVLPIEVGKNAVKSVDVAGVSCYLSPPTMPPCDILAESASGVGSNCIHGEVRLTGDGQTEHKGRLEMCYSNQWTPFCDIDESVALVACKQLEYTQSSWATMITTGEFGQSLNYSLVSSITCSQTPTAYTLTDCTIVQEECLPACSINVGIHCFVPGSCEEGSFSLVNGVLEYEGEIRVCINGVWGSICADEWDQTDAYVFCKQLGYIDAGIVAFDQLYPWYGLSPMAYSDVKCVGWENSLEECSKKAFLEFSCSESMVAGALCAYSCSDGDIRLSGGNDSNGTLEICFNSIWGLVSLSGWGEKDTEVTCGQLGFLRKGAVALIPSNFGKPNLPILASDVYCTGDESKLTECSMTVHSLDNGRNLLGQVNVIGVSCQNPNTCQAPPSGGNDCLAGDIQLIAGGSSTLQSNSAPSQGTLQYCYKGLWSSMCSISESAATVACKQMGFTNYSWASIYDDGQFISSDNWSYFQNLVCSENASEANLTECTLFDACTSTCNSSTVGIQCYEPGECLEGSVHLADGDISQEGRVEVCLGGVWGSVCGDGWDQTDAHTLCEQLNLGDGEPTLYSNSEFGDGEGPIVLSSVECGGWETDIFQCSSKKYLSFSCPRSHTAGVLCRDLCTDGDVRLSGGLNESQGTVEVCFDNLWGLVAQSEWSASDAEVTCRQLGYLAEGALAVLNSYYGKPNRTLHLTNVVCTGLEDRLTDCSHSVLPIEVGKSTVKHVDVAGVSCHLSPATMPPCDIPAESASGVGSNCIHGEVRLTGNGHSEQAGRLEMCYGNQWTPFCDIDESVALVACKQLEYTQSSWATVITTGEFGQSLNYSLISSITCSQTPTEYTLTDCTIVQEECLPACSINVGIHCFVTEFCEEGSFSLVNGVLEYEGEIRVCINGVWGSICADEWDQTDAYVFCKQLGYIDTEILALNQLYPWYGQSPMVYSDVKCIGWENSLEECPKKEFLEFSCSESMVAGALCGYACSDGDIRLSGGSDSNGTLEICFNSIWGLVSLSGWGEKDTEVTCGQLGFLREGAIALLPSNFGKPNLPILASDVYCIGDESKLTECSMTVHSLDDGRNLLSQVNVVGVSCQNPSTCEAPPSGGKNCLAGDIQLIAGGSSTLQSSSVPSQGTLQYCYKGLWSSMCFISESAATVACKQMGFTNYSWASIYDDGRFISSGNWSYFQNLVCSESANEANLTQCTLFDACTSICNSSTVGIRCYEPGECLEGSVQLADGDISQEGRVEVCLGGVWGSVCGDGWDQTDAHTLCEQLNLGDEEPTLYSNSEFGEGEGPIVLSSVECGGWETDIFQCSSNKYLSFSCPRSHTAGVLCRDLCTDGDVRLSGGLTENEGTVEVCFDNLWGLVAQSEWSTSDAEVTCRQLGYLAEGAHAVLNSFYGKPDRTLHLSTVSCTGSEDKLVECSSERLSLEDGKVIIKHVEVAGVSCMKSKVTSTSSLPISSSTPSLDANEHLTSYSTIYIVVGILGSTILIGLIIIIILLAVVCSRTRGLPRRPSWNVYEPNTMVLQNVAEGEGATKLLSSASQEVLKKTEEL